MKSLKYMIDYAIIIAGNEPEAHIGVFCNWQKANSILQDMKPYGTMKWQSREFISLQGATIKFTEFYGINDLSDKICGTNFSHVFHADSTYYDYKIENLIKSRLRSTKEFKDYPIGYYNEFGVTRIEDY